MTVSEFYCARFACAEPAACYWGLELGPESGAVALLVFRGGLCPACVDRQDLTVDRLLTLPLRLQAEAFCRRERVEHLNPDGSLRARLVVASRALPGQPMRWRPVVRANAVGAPPAGGGL